MANRLFSTLVPTIAASAPGCPTPTAIEYIRKAAIEACERTLFWRYQIPEFSLVPGKYEYEYSVPANTDVHAIFATLMNGRELEPLTIEQAAARFPTWPEDYPTWDYDAHEWENEDDSWFGSGSQPQAICQVNPNKYIVLPVPDDGAPYNVNMFVALKPSRSATGIDEVVFNELEDAIMHNTLQRLLMLPNQNWSDREAAGYHARQYVFKLAERRARANLGNVRGTLSVRIPSFS